MVLSRVNMFMWVRVTISDEYDTHTYNINFLYYDIDMNVHYRGKKVSSCSDSFDTINFLLLFKMNIAIHAGLLVRFLNM
jgi:hypothetical protein